MKKLILFGGIALSQGLEPSLDEEMGLHEMQQKPIDFMKVAYAPPSVKCSEKEICDTFTTLNQWSFLIDGQKYNGKWELKSHDWVEGNTQLAMTEEYKYYGLSRDVGAWSSKEPIAFSMNVRFDESHNCGGAYIKLYQSQLHDLSGNKPYSIMFGPDRCGVNTRKVHFIVQYTDPAGIQVEEHLETPVKLPSDMRKTHQYGFTLSPEGNLEILLDNSVVASGHLKSLTTPGWKSPETIDDPEDVAPEDWVPPPKMIPDPTAEKPEDWDETEPEFIEDADAVMPDDWLENEPDLVPNTEAEKPANWIDEEDGEWTRPLMKNPRCAMVSGCGKWVRPMIPNPLYRGPWSPPMIANPSYTEKYPMRQIPHPKPYVIEDPMSVIRPFNKMGMELWTVQAGTVMDNFYFGQDVEKMKNWAVDTFKQISEVEEENYQRQLQGVQPKEEKPEDQNRYVKLGAVCLVGLIVVYLAARRLLAPVFRQSDIPKKTDEPTEAAKTEEKKDNAENTDKDDQPTETSEKKTNEENESKQVEGETRPTKRN